MSSIADRALCCATPSERAEARRCPSAMASGESERESAAAAREEGGEEPWPPPLAAERARQRCATIAAMASSSSSCSLSPSSSPFSAAGLREGERRPFCSAKRSLFLLLPSVPFPSSSSSSAAAIARLRASWSSSKAAAWSPSLRTVRTCPRRERREGEEEGEE